MIGTQNVGGIKLELEQWWGPKLAGFQRHGGSMVARQTVVLQSWVRIQRLPGPQLTASLLVGCYLGWYLAAGWPLWEATEEKITKNELLVHQKKKHIKKNKKISEVGQEKHRFADFDKGVHWHLYNTEDQNKMGMATSHFLSPLATPGRVILFSCPEHKLLPDSVCSSTTTKCITTPLRPTIVVRNICRSETATGRCFWSWRNLDRFYESSSKSIMHNASWQENSMWHWREETPTEALTKILSRQDTHMVSQGLIRPVI